MINISVVVRGLYWHISRNFQNPLSSKFLKSHKALRYTAHLFFLWHMAPCVDGIDHAVKPHELNIISTQHLDFVWADLSNFSLLDQKWPGTGNTSVSLVKLKLVNCT